ncbi:AAA family ATPase [Streptomyces sp. UG1]|uniref:AAA family ATPase n=1 Tax=Streptomyces sp. UG1 TaxID=3417652 RepID=UPI003CEE1FD7
MGEAALLEYEQGRSIWHANLGPIGTPQLKALHEDLWDILASNQQDGDKAKGAVAVDAFPGLGKTTAVLDFALKHHRQVIEREGAFTAAGHERRPVCRVGLTSNIGMKEFNRSLLEYYAHPGRTTGTAALFAQRALDCVLECETRILVIDDLHFLKWHDRNGTEVSNHDKHRREWRRMLLALQKRIVLCQKFPGMLADELSDYLYIRTTGHIGSLMTLINRGCQRAARTGAELLDEELLDQVKLDAAAERARKALAKKSARGRMTTRTRSRATKNASAKTVA